MSIKSGPWGSADPRTLCRERGQRPGVQCGWLRGWCIGDVGGTSTRLELVAGGEVAGGAGADLGGFYTLILQALKGPEGF